MRADGLKTSAIAVALSAGVITLSGLWVTPASAYDPSNLVDPANPASPLSPLNPSNPQNINNPANPASPLNPNNPANPNSPLNPANQWSYGYGYGYGGANPTLVGLAFWTGQPYTYWACKLGVDFQCPASPNYAYRRPTPAAAYASGDEVQPLRQRHRHRRHR